MAFLKKPCSWLVICLFGLIFMGCMSSGASVGQRVEIEYQDGVLKKYHYVDNDFDNQNSVFVDPLEVIVDSGGNLPADLPIPRKFGKKSGDTRQYTGIIRNKTKTDITVPSQNSLATLVVPARGWVEYIVWRPRTKFTAYRDGKPLRCFNICVNPRGYPFMCKNYDFMAVIEPTEKPEKPMFYKKYKKRYRKRRG